MALISALDAAAAGLEADDLRAARAALEQAGEAVRALQAAGARLGPAELARAADLQARCLRAAGPALEGLQGALRQAGLGNRAITAYGG